MEKKRSLSINIALGRFIFRFIFGFIVKIFNFKHLNRLIVKYLKKYHIEKKLP